MAQLLNQTRGLCLAPQVIEAKSLWTRTKGLLGRKSFSTEETLWIHHCNSIHTFFMQFPLDVIFVDSQLRVKKVIRNLKPWRLILPVWSASSVFEFTAGALAHEAVDKGDQLYVGA